MNASYVKSFKELRVYQKSREVSSAVFRLSKGFAKEETYSLTDQFRRAARSIGAQIAEAWGKRSYEKHFFNKLSGIPQGFCPSAQGCDEGATLGKFRPWTSTPKEISAKGRLFGICPPSAK